MKVITMEALGLEVNREDYRHSTFTYKNIHVENHKICTTVRGKRQRKYLNAIFEVFSSSSQQ